MSRAPSPRPTTVAGIRRCTSVPSPGVLRSRTVTAVPRHPAVHGIRPARAGRRAPRRGRTRRRGRGRTRSPRPARPRVHADLVHPGVLGGVDHRLAGGQHERAQVVVQRPVAPDDDGRTVERVGVLDLGGRRGERVGQAPVRRIRARAPVPAGPVQPGPQLALLAAGQPRTSRGESDWRWISARVCSTESCRCAAISARSASRMRSLRSSPRSRTSRTHHGTVITATPTSVASTASSPNCTCPMSRLPSRNTAIPAATNSAPAITRSSAARQPVRAPAPAHRRRCASSASRHTTAAPTTATPSGPTTQPRRRVAQRGGGEPDAEPERGEPERLLALARAAPPARRSAPPAGRRSTAVRRRAPRRRRRPSSATNAARTHSTVHAEVVRDAPGHARDEAAGPAAVQRSRRSRRGGCRSGRHGGGHAPIVTRTRGRAIGVAAPISQGVP